jgi:hypothetical protein
MNPAARPHLVRVLPAAAWTALARAMHDPDVMPFPPAYQLRYLDADAPWPERFEPEEVSYQGDYREGVLPYAQTVEWLRLMTWCLVPNPRYAKYGRWRAEGPSRRLSCEAELRAALGALGIPFTEDASGCFVVQAFTPG